jgi:hypothetical protein
MREYEFEEKKYEGYHRPIDDREKPYEFDTYSVKIYIDHLTISDVEYLRTVVREVASRGD